jgi:hypothetical protein
MNDETRTVSQNKKLWPMLDDIRRHIPIWYDYPMQTEDYKDLITALWRKQTIIPDGEGGMVALGVRTSKLYKKDFADLIEYIYAFGTLKGVKWSEPALKAYEQYREAQ